MAGIQIKCPDLDSIVDAYEDARLRGDPGVAVRKFLPPRSHSHYLDILTELVRVDMEYRWGRDDRTSLADYCDEFPELRANRDCLSKTAYEEYRLRRQAGEQLESSEYATHWHVNVEEWPSDSIEVADEAEAGTASEVLSREFPNSLGSSVEWDEFSRRDRVTARSLSEMAGEFPKPGERYGDFEIVEELGRGAFARVFLARQGDLADRYVALKIGAVGSAESRRLAQLQHTNIVPVYSVHRRGNAQAICMPFFGRSTFVDVLRIVRRRDRLPDRGKELVSTLSGGRVSTLGPGNVTTGKPLLETGSSPEVSAVDFAKGSTSNESTSNESTSNESTANESTANESASNESTAKQRLEQLSFVNAVVWLVARVAEGLAHAHDHGIVHRDLKPANILLADSGQPLILDFNIASEVSCSSSAAAMVGGTLPYMSPEQLEAYRSGGVVDRRSDIYSLGIILFELLTGRDPFPRHVGSSNAVIQKMIDDRQGGLPSVRAGNSRVSPGLESIVHRCLTFDRAKRYQSASELVNDLECLLHDRPLKTAPEKSWRERFHKWTRRHPRLASGGSIAFLASLLVVGGIASWIGYDKQLKTMEAVQQLAEVEDLLPEVRVALGDFGLGEESRAVAFEKAAAQLARYRALSDPDWRQHYLIRSLADDKQHELRAHIAELATWMARAKINEAQKASGETSSVLYDEALSLTSCGQACYADAKVPESIRWIAAMAKSRGGASPIGPDEIRFDKLEPLDEMNLVTRSLRDGDFVDAEHRLESLMVDRPRDFAAWFWLAHSYWGQGRLIDSEVAFSVCVALRPQSYLGYFHRGLVRLERRLPIGAEADFSRCIQLQPQFSSTFVNRGIARQQLNRHDEAIADFGRALELGAKETRIYFLRSRSEASVGRQSDAAADFAEGIRRQPVDEASWLARGFAKLANDAEGALADFQSALRENPSSIKALQFMSNVLGENLARSSEAIDCLDQLNHRQPTRALWHSSRAVLFARQGNVEKSLESIKKAGDQLIFSEYGSEASFVRYQLACGYVLLGNKTNDKSMNAAAIDLLRQAFGEQVSLANIARNDPDLEAIRSSDAFQHLMTAANSFMTTSPK